MPGLWHLTPSDIRFSKAFGSCLQDHRIYIDNTKDEDVSFTYDIEYNGTLSQVMKGTALSNYGYEQLLLP